MLLKNGKFLHYCDLFFPIHPVAKARPAITKTGLVYTKKKTREFENNIQDLAIKQLQKLEMGKPIEGGVAIEVEFALSIPKSYTGKKRRDCMEQKKLPLVFPDLDNLIKSLLDGMNKILYRDDKQIVWLSSSKSVC